MPTRTSTALIRVDRTMPRVAVPSRLVARLDRKGRVRLALPAWMSENSRMVVAYAGKAQAYDLRFGRSRVLVRGERLGMHAWRRPGWRSLRVIATDLAGNRRITRTWVYVPALPAHLAGTDQEDEAPGGDGNDGSARGRFSHCPTRGTITGVFGEDRQSHVHSGLDVAAPTGTAVLSAAAGKIVFAGLDGTLTSGYGNTVVVDHGDGRLTRYAHLSRITNPVGTLVTGGALIGRVGNTGSSTGPHLHMEVRIDTMYGGPIEDPMLHLPRGCP